MNGYHLSPAAFKDLEDIRAYLLRTADVRVASYVLDGLRAGIQRLAISPGIGHMRLDLAGPELRFFLVFKYLVIYTADTQPLGVARVLHSARDVKRILDSFPE